MAIVGTPYNAGIQSHSLSNNMVVQVEEWKVQTDGASTMPEIRDASPIPAYYSRHPTETNWYVANKRVRRNGNGDRHWVVDVEYTGDLYGAPWPADVADLVSQDPDIEWATEETVESIDTDIYGRRLCNAVYEDFDPPLSDTRSYATLVISRNESYAAFGIAKLRAFVNHINLGPFYGQAPLTVLCKRISAKLQTVNTFAYWRVTYAFWFKDYWLPAADIYASGATIEEPWGQRVANMGRRQPKLTSVSGRFAYEPIKDANGDPIQTPVPIGLDGLPVSQQQGASTVWLGFKTKPRADFSLLQLE